MTKVRLKDLKKGEYFTIKEIEYPTDSQVFIREEYDRSTKKFQCAKCSDVWGTGRQFKGDREVYIDFTY